MSHSIANGNNGKSLLVQQSYIVCSNIRSGSTLLCKTLERLQGYGSPTEYFNPNVISKLNLDNPERFEQYCESILQESLSLDGVFGMKLHWPQFQKLLSLARTTQRFSKSHDLEIIHSLFPNPKFIFLKRLDVVAQAVSATIAYQTNQWGLLREDTLHPSATQADFNQPPKPMEIQFQPIRIFALERRLRRDNQNWEDFLLQHSLPYHEVIYENLAENFVPEMQGVLKYLGFEPNPEHWTLEPPTLKQATQINQDFSRTYQLLPMGPLTVAYWVDRLYKGIFHRLRRVWNKVNSVPLKS